MSQHEYTKDPKSLGLISIALISVAGIFGLRNLPLMATYGFSSITWYIIAALIYFIPSSLVCAELATGWPEYGGMYIWVKKGLGHKLGFLSIWYEWTNTIVWYPTVLTFIAATIAYSFAPNLANNQLFMFSTVLGVFWGATLINFFGIRVSSFISGFGIVVGTLIPGAILIIMAGVWLWQGNPSQIEFSIKALKPDLTLSHTALLAGLVLSFAGMQVTGFHANEVKNPQRNFPLGILVATVIILLASIFGALAIAMVIPANEISLVSGIMQTMRTFFAKFGLSGAEHFIAFLIALGTIAAVNTWLIGPSKGILVSAEDGHLPKILSKHNRHGVPTAILFCQAIIVTLLASVFLFMPTVNSSYWLLSALTAILTMFMNLLLFIAAIALRFNHPEVVRSYRVPFGNIGMLVTAGIGAMVCVVTIMLGFIPPDQIETGNIMYYEGFLITGIILFTLPALIFFAKLKPNVQEKSSIRLIV